MNGTTERTMTGELAHLNTLADAVADYLKHSKYAPRSRSTLHDGGKLTS